MDYTLRRSARAKRMSLRLNEKGALTLVLPRFVPEIAGKAFVLANTKWIERQRSKILLKVHHYADEIFKTGDELIFFDQKIYTIRVCRLNQKKSSFKLSGRTLELVVSKQSGQDQIKRLIENFYREQARTYLTDRSEFFAAQLHTSFNDLRIKNTKSRWGSCSSHKNLNYNWRIMMAPKAVIDYLVIHEVCHLKQMNHSPKFWTLVESLDPNFKTHKSWLKANQTRLFGFLQNST